MSENIVIKKAKLKDSLFLEAEFTEVSNSISSKTNKSCDAPVHNDLRIAFYKLSVHLALLCEQVVEAKNRKKVTVMLKSPLDQTEIEVGDMFSFDDRNLTIAQGIFCTGFSIGGSGDNEGVTLLGRRELGHDRILNLVSPFQKWQDDQNDYPYSFGLSEAVEVCKQEVYLYLFEGKKQPNKQLSMDFDGANNEDNDQDELSN